MNGTKEVNIQFKKLKDVRIVNIEKLFKNYTEGVLELEPLIFSDLLSLDSILKNNKKPQKNQKTKKPQKNSKKDKLIKEYIQDNIVAGVMEETNEYNIFNKIFIQEKDSIKKENIILLNPLVTNKVSINKNVYFPNPRKIIKKLKNSYTISLDMSQAFYSIPIHEEFKRATAFKHMNKCYRFKVLPFGLLNSPYYLQRFLSATLRNIKLRLSNELGIQKNKIFYTNYMDDSLIILQGEKNYNNELRIKIKNLIDEELVNTGWISNKEKYSESPNINWLGYKINTKLNIVSYKPRKSEENMKYVYKNLRYKNKIKIKKLVKIFGIVNSYSKFFNNTWLKKAYGKLIAHLFKEKFGYILTYKKLYKQRMQIYREKIGVKIYEAMKKKYKKDKNNYAEKWFQEFVITGKLKLKFYVKKMIHRLVRKQMKQIYPNMASFKIYTNKEQWKIIKNEEVYLHYNIKKLFYNSINKLFKPMKIKKYKNMNYYTKLYNKYESKFNTFIINNPIFAVYSIQDNEYMNYWIPPYAIKILKIYESLHSFKKIEVKHQKSNLLNIDYMRKLYDFPSDLLSLYNEYKGDLYVRINKIIKHINKLIKKDEMKYTHLIQIKNILNSNKKVKKFIYKLVNNNDHTKLHLYQKLNFEYIFKNTLNIL